MENVIFIIAGLFIAVLVTGLLSSCSVVKTNFSTDSKKEAIVYYYLPENVININTTVKVAVVYNDKKIVDSKVIEQRFSVSTNVVADTRDLLSLKYKPNILMSDKIKYVVNAKGLLDTIEVTTEDKTPEIIKTIAEAPQAILKITRGVKQADDTLGFEEDNSVVKIKEYSADFAVMASSISSNPTPIHWEYIIENELGKGEYKIGSADFNISSKDSISKDKQLLELINDENKPDFDEVNGILTRPLKNLNLEFKSEYTKNLYCSTTNIPVLDKSKIIIVPVRRTLFVKRENNIGIKDGMIISNEITNPSSVEGFVSIPINIAKAIVSIPAQIIQFRIDNTTKSKEFETAKLSYEQSVLENQKYAISLEKKLEEEKLKTQKELLEIRKELEKLNE